MTKVVVQKRVLDVLAREVAILAAQLARTARDLEKLHQALLLVGGLTTGDRTEVGVGRSPLSIVEDQDDSIDG